MDTHTKLAGCVWLVLAGLAIAQNAVPAKDRIAAIKPVADKAPIGIWPAASVSQIKWSWRFCHDGTSLTVVPFWTDSKTITRYDLVECPYLSQATNQICLLGLIISKEQQDRINELEAIPTTAAVGGVGP